MNRRLLFLLALVIFAAPVSAAAQDAKPGNPLNTAFDKLKSLSGTWKASTKDEGIPKDGKVTYRVTANGSAVIETIFPGTKMEMVSVYHRDGDNLLMTHYCAAQNQPRFRGRYDTKKKELVLEFAGGTNLNEKKDMHIHGGRIQFVDNDNVRSEWEFFVDGKRAGSHKIKMERMK